VHAITPSVPWFIASWLPLILLDAAQTALSTVIAEQRG
jgi:hypothetical protein